MSATPGDDYGLKEALAEGSDVQENLRIRSPARLSGARSNGGAASILALRPDIIILDEATLWTLTVAKK